MNLNRKLSRLVPRDISADYERIIAEPYGTILWQDFLRTLKQEQFLLLRIDLSQETDRNQFVWRANFMKAFAEGGINKRYTINVPGQKRAAIIKCTKEQYQKWGAANAFSSGVEWEETAS